MLVFLVFVIIFFIVFVVWFTKLWNTGMKQRQASAEEQRKRHSGQTVLEWDRPRAQGEPDGEFGPLFLEISKKIGSGKALFYERGAVVGRKRIPYDTLKDVVFFPHKPGRAWTLKQKIQNAGVLWLYRKGKSTIGIRDLNYRFEEDDMQAVQDGLGFIAPKQ